MTQELKELVALRKEVEALKVLVANLEVQLGHFVLAHSALNNKVDAGMSVVLATEGVLNDYLERFKSCGKLFDQVDSILETHQKAIADYIEFKKAVSNHYKMNYKQALANELRKEGFL